VPRGDRGSAGGDIVIVGANQLDALSKRLKAAGSEGKQLRKELLKAIRDAAKPAVGDVKRSVDQRIPSSGGLARKVRVGIGVRTRASGPKTGVRIVARNKINVEALNAGRLRHPVFGNTNVWVQQRVEPGWFTKPIEARQDEIRGSVVDAIDRIARKVEGH
jgi:hypothetical protein